MLTLPAFELTQKKNTIYLCYATAAELSRWLSNKGFSMNADIWDKEKNPEGYQRQPDSEKVNAVAEFLRGKRGVDPILPSSIVLNIRSSNPRDVKFEPIDQRRRFGLLTIDDRAGALWEVDGQHRLRGLAKAVNSMGALSDYCLPLTILVGLQKPLEALQFVAINTTQMKVKPDLVLRILWKRYRDNARAAEQLLKGQTWKIEAINIVEALNSDKASPFFDCIAPPGVSKKGKLISEGMFVSSLEPLARFRSRFFNAKFIQSYWMAVRAVWAQASDSSKRKSYGLFTGVGPYVLHKIAPIVALRCDDSEGSHDTKSITYGLSKIRAKFTDRFWLKQGGRVSDYSSRGGYNTLAGKMVRELLRLGEPRIPPRVPKLEVATKHLLTLHLFREYDRSDIKAFVPRGATGTYVLLRFRDNACYVGMDGSDLQRRLLEHKKKGFDLFNFKLARESVASDLERYVWHTLIGAKGWKLQNKVHPKSSTGKRCPLCSR